MFPFLIQNSQQLQENINLVMGSISLFWIVEYSPQELGYQEKTNEYLLDLKRYTFLRNECRMHPTDFKERLDKGVYRIWTTTPQDFEW